MRGTSILPQRCVEPSAVRVRRVGEGGREDGGTMIKFCLFLISRDVI